MVPLNVSKLFVSRTPIIHRHYNSSDSDAVSIFKNYVFCKHIYVDLPERRTKLVLWPHKGEVYSLVFGFGVQDYLDLLGSHTIEDVEALVAGKLKLMDFYLKAKIIVLHKSLECQYIVDADSFGEVFDAFYKKQRPDC